MGSITMRTHGTSVIISICIFVTKASIIPEIPREIEYNTNENQLPRGYNYEGTSNRIGVDPENIYPEYNNDVTINEDSDSDVTEENKGDGDYDMKMPDKTGKWVLVTPKYRKKHRKTNFRNFTMNKADVLRSFNLEKKWKIKILEALENGVKKVKHSRTRTVLKSSSGNELTILSNDAIMHTTSSRRFSPRENVTCTVIEEYACTFTVTRNVRRPCWFQPEYLCTETVNEVVKATCRRKVEKCCDDYELAASGYCEKPRPPTFPPPTEATTTCGRVLAAREGVLTSPNYPNFYPNNARCTWRVIAPAGFKVILKFIDLNVEDPIGACDLQKWECFELCGFDALKITDHARGSVKTICGRRSPTSQFVSGGNSIQISFTSDVSSGGTGFKIIYSIASEYELSTLHRSCVGGQTWQLCHHKCARTCQRHQNTTHVTCMNSDRHFTNIATSRRDEITCIPGCACPPGAPIWHNGKCIKPESCPDRFFECGKPAVPSKLKIVGGRTAGKHAWPWMVQIETESIFHICGASLICSNWVVTAAHCFLNANATGLDLDERRYLVNVGKYWKDDQQDGRIVQTYEPDKIIAHPDYRVNMVTKVDTNDIALIKLTHAVDVTDYVRPVCLPHPTIQGVTTESSRYAQYQQPTIGTKCQVLGWGTTRGVGPKYDRLKEASISIQPGKSCVYSSYDWKLMVCAGGHKDEDTCRGDSGGPLLCKRSDNIWFLDGVTSFGNACGEEGVAGGYTRVSSYIGWIRSYTGYKCES